MVKLVPLLINGGLYKNAAFGYVAEGLYGSFKAALNGLHFEAALKLPQMITF
jgi:hypothetical protein